MLVRRLFLGDDVDIAESRRSQGERKTGNAGSDDQKIRTVHRVIYGDGNGVKPDERSSLRRWARSIIIKAFCHCNSEGYEACRMQEGIMGDGTEGIVSLYFLFFEIVTIDAPRSFWHACCVKGQED